MLTAELHEKLIECADAHQAADEYIAGDYDAGPSKGCAVGCSIKDCQRLGLMDRSIRPSDHAAIAEATGVPELAWWLADHVFEGLPSVKRSAWPPRFWRAVRAGADYSRFVPRVMARLADKLAADAIRPGVAEVARVVAALWRRRAAGDDPQQAEWQAAWRQADAARRQASATLRQDYVTWQQAGMARRQADIARRQADIARQQADLALRQDYVKWQQASVAWQQADVVLQQAGVALRHTCVARQQADATLLQAGVARQQFWRFVADVVCEELSFEASRAGS
jgi:hypothetical protein